MDFVRVFHSPSPRRTLALAVLKSIYLYRKVIPLGRGCCSHKKGKRPPLRLGVACVRKKPGIFGGAGVRLQRERDKDFNTIALNCTFIVLMQNRAGAKGYTFN